MGRAPCEGPNPHCTHQAQLDRGGWGKCATGGARTSNRTRRHEHNLIARPSASLVACGPRHCLLPNSALGPGSASISARPGEGHAWWQRGAGGGSDPRRVVLGSAVLHTVHRPDCGHYTRTGGRGSELAEAMQAGGQLGPRPPTQDSHQGSRFRLALGLEGEARPGPCAYTCPWRVELI